MSSDTLNLFASILFAIAVAHTLACAPLHRWSESFAAGSFARRVLSILGEVELVFGYWAIVLLVVMGISGNGALDYLGGLRFLEPLFVVVVMTVAASKPIIALARSGFLALARAADPERRFGLPSGTNEMFFFGSCLVIGPLLGSFLTEPAAMTVSALVLRDRYFARGLSKRFQYATLAVLFVNVSIGGVMTPFAAPPVLMVADKWGWGFGFMLRTFAARVVLATLVNAAFAIFVTKRELRSFSAVPESVIPGAPTRNRDGALLLLFLATAVVLNHHPWGLLFVGAAFAAFTRRIGEKVNWKPGLLVGAFLAGLVVLGGLQSWWLAPLLKGTSPAALFLGATALTAVTDNAALTFLGAQIEGVSDLFKYCLVSGALAGGGLTVIANAPNPAGYALLEESFGPDGISAFELLKWALVPTAVAAACLWPFS